jgi:hypothetical protein
MSVFMSEVYWYILESSRKQVICKNSIIIAAIAKNQCVFLMRESGGWKIMHYS